MSDTKDTENKFLMFLHIFPKGNREKGGYNCCFEIDSPEEGRNYIDNMYEAIIDRFEEDKKTKISNKVNKGLMKEETFD